MVKNKLSKNIYLHFSFFYKIIHHLSAAAPQHRIASKAKLIVCDIGKAYKKRPHIPTLICHHQQSL
jgi:hypothetical protein